MHVNICLKNRALPVQTSLFYLIFLERKHVLEWGGEAEKEGEKES